MFERDKFTCQKCGVVRTSINAEHIKTFAEIYYENNIKTMDEAIKCSLFWDINNGKTLCLSCHKETESYAKKYKKNENSNTYKAE